MWTVEPGGHFSWPTTKYLPECELGHLSDGPDSMDYISTGYNESLQQSHMPKDTRFTDVEFNFTITNETLIQMLSLLVPCRAKVYNLGSDQSSELTVETV